MKIQLLAALVVLICTSPLVATTNEQNVDIEGSVNMVVFYLFDNVQGVVSNNLAQFGYQDRDYTSAAFYNDGNGGTIEESPWGGIETGFYGNVMFSAPFLRQDHPLLEDNRISIDMRWEFNWMQAETGIHFTFQPVPFYYFSMGLDIGSGWEWLWDQDGEPVLTGLGVYGNEGLISTPLGGPVIRFSLTNGLQMDLSALPFIPDQAKRWTHLILTARGTFQYMALTTVGEEKLFSYQLQDYQNGWDFEFENQFGYRIPVIEDLDEEGEPNTSWNNKNISIFPLLQTTVTIPMTNYFDAVMGSGGYGSDFISVELNPLLILELPRNFSFILYSQFSNDRRFSNESLGNQYLLTKTYTDWLFQFDKIGFIFGWKFI
jgi:hypothetical protein